MSVPLKLLIEKHAGGVLGMLFENKISYLTAYNRASSSIFSTSSIRDMQPPLNMIEGNLLIYLW